MTRKLDRPGIFKARPISWAIRTSDNSRSVAVNMEFLITAQLDNDEWVDWTPYEEHRIFGAFYVIKRDGAVNTPTVEQLVAAIGWSGDLTAIAGPPPDVIVQITVQAEEYKGRETLKVNWINPGNFSPRPPSATDGEVRQLQSQFGSLLRAAAASAAQNGAAKAVGGDRGNPPPAAAVAPPNATEGGTAVATPGDEQSHTTAAPPEEPDDFEAMDTNQLTSWLFGRAINPVDRERLSTLFNAGDTDGLRVFAREVVARGS